MHIHGLIVDPAFRQPGAGVSCIQYVKRSSREAIVHQQKRGIMTIEPVVENP
jgi:ribosomal protein S18 acetylase RimI-like enzyme